MSRLCVLKDEWLENKTRRECALMPGIFSSSIWLTSKVDRQSFHDSTPLRSNFVRKPLFSLFETTPLGLKV